MKILLGGNKDVFTQIFIDRFKYDMLELCVETIYKPLEIQFHSHYCLNDKELINRINRAVSSLNRDYNYVRPMVVGFGPQSAKISYDDAVGYVALIAETRKDDEFLTNVDYYNICGASVYFLMLSENIYDGRKRSKSMYNKTYFPYRNEEEVF